MTCSRGSCAGIFSDPVKILLSNLMYRQALILISTNLRRDREFYMKVGKITGQNFCGDRGEARQASEPL